MGMKLFLKRKKIIVNAGLFGFSSVFQKGIGLILLPVFTTFLSTREYGLITVSTLMYNFLAVVFLFGFEHAIKRLYYKYDKNDQQLKSLYTSILCSILILSFIMSGIILKWNWFIELFFDEEVYTPFLQIILVSSILNAVYNFYQTVLISRQQAMKNTVLNLVYGVTVFLITFIGLYSFNIGVKGILLIQLFANLVITIFVFTHFVTINLSFTHFIAFQKEALLLAMPLMPHSVLSWMSTIVDKLVITKQLGTDYTGIYNAGFQVSSILTLLVLSFHKSYVPWCYEQLNGGKGKYANIVKLTEACFGVYFIVALGIILFAKEGILILAGADYVNAISIVSILVISIFVHSVYLTFIIPIFYRLKNIWLTTIITMISFVLSIVLNIIFVDRMGLVGAAWATLISKVVLCSLVVLFSLWTLNIGLKLYPVILYTTALLLMNYLVYYFDLIFFLRVGILITCISFLMLIYLMQKKIITRTSILTE